MKETLAHKPEDLEKWSQGAKKWLKDWGGERWGRGYLKTVSELTKTQAHPELYTNRIDTIKPDITWRTGWLLTPTPKS